jgi:hypothetical protein
MRRHRVACIDAQVEQRVLELGRIDPGCPKPAGANHLELDIRADRPPNQVLHAGDEAVHIKGFRVQRLPAREG